MTTTENQKLREALKAALTWIDAVPQEAQLPAMPGFDRDEVDALLAQPTEGGELVAYIENGVLVNCTLPVGFTGPLYTAPPASKPTHITWDASGRRLINGAPDCRGTQ